MRMGIAKMDQKNARKQEFAGVCVLILLPTHQGPEETGIGAKNKV